MHSVSRVRVQVVEHQHCRSKHVWSGLKTSSKQNIMEEFRLHSGSILGSIGL